MSNSRSSGPTAQEALLSLAFDNSSAERPSKSRKLTSLPSIAPTMLPRLDTTSTTSGSGLFQVDFGCSPASIPVPTEDIVGALVNTSASGPMPTSRYWLQAFCSISTCFSFIASAEPGFSFEKSSPTSRTTSLRMASAEAGLPRARSSITRSSIEMAKVTPAAFSTCRSTGASSQGFLLSRRSGGVLATMAFEIADPLALCGPQRGCRIRFLAERADTVAKLALTSKTPSPRTATTAGPPASGSQTRPTSVPDVPSSGRTSFAVSVIIGLSPSCL